MQRRRALAHATLRMHPGARRRGAGHVATLRAFELTAEGARYEAGRVRRQYDAVEPENRLAARTSNDTRRATFGPYTHPVLIVMFI
jgi:hypothetical protein